MPEQIPIDSLRLFDQTLMSSTVRATSPGMYKTGSYTLPRWPFAGSRNLMTQGISFRYAAFWTR